MTSSTETTADAWGPPLTTGERACLGCIAGHMIPASQDFGIPGADDPAIIADMAASVQRDRRPLARLLRRVDEEAGGVLAALPASEREMLLARLRAADPQGFAVVESAIARA